jgi:hypothetical protein
MIYDFHLRKQKYRRDIGPKETPSAHEASKVYSCQPPRAYSHTARPTYQEHLIPWTFAGLPTCSNEDTPLRGYWIGPLRPGHVDLGLRFAPFEG